MIEVTGFRDRAVALLGLGGSGLAAARALAAGGARVRAWDDDPGRRRAAEAADVPLVDLRRADWNGVAALVLSPGIPLTHPEPHPVVTLARSAGAEVIGDIELFARAPRRAALAGVTGTNGKSTTTALIGHILAHCGRAVEVGGNLGPPALDLAPLPAGGTYVLELSSYQLDLAPSLVCDVAVLLNITPDHLDRHGDMARYVAVKRHVFHGQGRDETAIVGVDDAESAAICDELRARADRTVVPVAVGRRVADGISVVDGLLYDPAVAEGEAVARLDRAPALPGAHNWQNAAAAYAAARALGLEAEAIAEAIYAFPGLAHRLERVTPPAGPFAAIAFVNDSKATNAVATARALACHDDVYWIAGGRPKEGGIAALAPYFGRIRHAFLIGEAAAGFAAALEGRVAYSLCGDLAAAVPAAAARAARDLAAGEVEHAVVLLSPACASFDQFTDFTARGDAFRALVAGLGEGAS